MSNTYISKAEPIRAIKWTGDNIDDVINFLGNSYISSNGTYVFFNRGKLTKIGVAGTCGICAVGNYIADIGIFTTREASDFEKEYMEFNEEDA